MARGQQQGLNAITVWMIIFVGLWLTSTVFLVILYTGQEAINTENSRLETRYRRVISGSEEKSIDLVKAAQDGGPTVVGLLEQARGETALLATGNDQEAAAEVRSKRDQILRSIQTDGLIAEPDGFADISYHDALSRLYEAFRAERELRKTAEDRAGQLETQVTQLVGASGQQKNDFEKRAKDATQQLAQCESDRAAYRAERDKVVEKLEREFDESRKRSDVELTNARTQRQAAEGRLTDLQKRLAAQQERMGELMIGPERLATARQPDGRILTAVPGDNAVYIDLGKSQGLVLGLQFAVYSAKSGIPDDGRAKAQIEVIGIGNSSAECRIVSVAGGEVIVEGDLIANPIYDRERPLTFVVLGEFDLDRDGAFDRSGAATVEALVTTWGGRVSNEVTPLTDFVVLGAAPKKPKPSADAAGGTAGAPSTAAPNDPVARAWNRYQDVSGLAKSLSVPVLTQDTFLNFLGYRGGRIAGR